MVEVIDADIMKCEGDQLRLIGGRCDDCAETQFPRANRCRRCGGAEVSAIPLSDRGVLWSWTVQRFPPPSPPYVAQGEGFEPFAVGYVELSGEVIVESILTVSDPAVLRIGMPMRLCRNEVRDETGRPTSTFAFAPDDSPVPA